MRKAAFCICEYKDLYQLCGNHIADQCLCLRYIDRTIPSLYFLKQKFQISKHLWLFSHDAGSYSFTNKFISRLIENPIMFLCEGALLLAITKMQQKIAKQIVKPP